ncbi:hypothetical protein ONA91_39065 [Micromonospora sp. DR5-3]|uniref:hypothetical protein n=1 Tax=unclassified Micromonospora TaxID=2617518 RepID=UPI0011D714D5|nr:MULTISPECIES: hypothetical protein [unclassified Micromonospora]MCW3820449.1 hypothetical protein [Micromonospora sp. DR5-3]TYC20387.1 hypothetical protein FXF52_31520 [Micromonospora sp. MP36]
MTKKMRGLAAVLLIVVSAVVIIGRTAGASPFETNSAKAWPQFGATSDPDLTDDDGPTAGPAELFNGTAALKQPSRSPFPEVIGSHAESTSVIWNGQYVMYYRTFISPTGATCSIPQGVAMATSNDSGATWTPVDGGRPLPALQTVQQGQSCSFDDSVKSTWVYSPDVIADGSRLVMVFEQRDHDPNYVAPGQGRSLHSIRYVTSTDGRNWSESTLLLGPGAVGAWDDEVGTPDIEKDGTGYLLTFHGHDATGRLKQTRGMVRLDALAGEYTGVRQKINLSPTPDWANFGVGMADMTRGPDGYWYIVFEAFSGASGACGRTDTQTVVGIARSTDAVTWSVAPTPLIHGRDGLSCGYDMPSWQILGDVRGIVTPNDPPEGGSLVRWDIRAR